MKTLRSMAEAISFTEREAVGRTVQIENLRIRFPRANPERLTGERLSRTYTTKPLVIAGGIAMFGELAIVHHLADDGWEGVWVDTFHARGPDRKLFWNGMPPGHRVSLPTHADSLFDRIVRENQGKTSGFFDVFAWKGASFTFIEYKGKGDDKNANEDRWIAAALNAGVEPKDLHFVSY